MISGQVRNLRLESCKLVVSTSSHSSSAVGVELGAEDGDARIRLEHSPASPESLALDARPRRLPSLSLPRPLLRASSSAETFHGGYEEAKKA